MVRFTLEGSVRPLLVAGHGIRLGKAQEELYRVLAMGFPVVTTFNGFDLVPNDHPCFVGRIGSVGTPGGNYALSQCDVLICVGTRNNIRQITYNWNNFAPQAKRIIVDIDQAELKKPTVSGISVLQDSHRFLTSLFSYKLNIDKNWLSSLRTYDKDNDIEFTPPYKFIRELTRDLPDYAIVY